MKRLKNNKPFIIAATLVLTAVSLFRVSLAFAASPTEVSDVLDRLKVGVSAVHSLGMTLPAGGITTGNTLTVTYTDFSADFAGAPTVTCGVGSAAAALAGRTLTLTGGATACTGALTVTPFTGTNPAAAGSSIVVMGGTAGIAGRFAVAIVAEDHVSIAGSIDPTITFNVGAQAPFGANCDGSYSGNGGTLALGSLTTTAVASSDVGVVNHICSRVSTNASGGVGVSVRSLYGALRSGIHPADLIPSSTGVMAAGTANYGLCASATRRGMDATDPVGAMPTALAPFAADCPENTAAGSVGILRTTAQNVWSTSGPVANGYHNMIIKAAISDATPANNDYADTLTFIATGTF